jgi:protein-glucosylgalactosylhydroxylysine glucosidase
LSDNRLTTTYSFRCRSGLRYRLRHITSIVCSAMHHQPDQHAVRLAAKARFDGFETLRAANRAIWNELWKGRIHLVGAEKRWQALADAAFFYLNSSVHASSPASTSIFGLATWHDYHYYYGHVMWDIETFAVPVLTVLQPEAAESILNYRFRTLGAARDNARLMGRRGLQFAWESAPSTGCEAAPLPGTAAWHEDHVSLDVTRAFAFYAHVCGENDFLRDKAWPVMSSVSEWLTTRVAKTRRGYEVRASMGIAEREDPAKNAAFTNMASVVVLRDALSTAKQLGRQANPKWRLIADAMVVPLRGKVIKWAFGPSATQPIRTLSKRPLSSTSIRPRATWAVRCSLHSTAYGRCVRETGSSRSRCCRRAMPASNVAGFRKLSSIGQIDFQSSRKQAPSLQT